MKNYGTSTDKYAYLWVVEIKFSPSLGNVTKGWNATVGAKLSREDARQEMAKWQKGNPDDKFRIRRYVRAGK